MNRVQAVLLLFVIAACGTADADQAGTQAVTGDSIQPMREMITRFQARHAPVHSFASTAPVSRAGLLERFARAVQDSSLSALRELTLSEAEFAYLYFPASIFSRPPYAQPPEITWLLTEQNNLKGEARLLRYYGGRLRGVVTHECEAEPNVQDGNTIWNYCTLTLRLADGSLLEKVRLFGSIIERDGRFKFGSLANKL